MNTTAMLTPNTVPNPSALRARGRLIPLKAGPLVMGVLNVTPDSFSDGGRYLDLDMAVAHAVEMEAQGADLIDIGSESTRPGAEPVAQEEESRRLIPVVKAVCRTVSVPVSVDTTKAVVARQALDAGAVLVNDISALRFDACMKTLIAETGAGLVLMHMQGTPKTMQQAPSYHDVVEEVRRFLVERIGIALEAGIAAEQILLDPGIGFGKNLEHNLMLLSRLDAVVALQYPVLVGVSRKAFIGQVLARPVDDRLMGTAAAVAVAVLRGARVIRVHDVAPVRDVVRMVEAIAKAKS